MRYSVVCRTLFFAGMFTFCTHFACLAQVNKNDSLILVDFFNNAYGSYMGNWTHTDNWLTAAPLKTWYGVTVTNQRVTALNLGYNISYFVSILSKGLGGLDALDTLDLSGDGFYGSVPDELGNLINLRYLGLRKTGLGGNLPTVLGKLTKLTYLDLSLNNLIGSIPSEIGKLTNLEVLNLRYNALQAQLPGSMVNLTKLKVLDLAGNKLEGDMLELLVNYPQLTYLDLQYNLITGNIPANIGTLTNLQYLDISFNIISGGIPPEMGKLVNITTMLNLAGNQLNGGIPAELGDIKGLQRLYLGYNHLSGTLPASLGNLTQLQVFNVFNNQLSGSIPQSFINLQQMQQFLIGINSFSDSLPVWVSHYPLLDILDIEVNRFTFSGMEQAAVLNIGQLRYSPQQPINVINGCNGRLYVSVGGTPGNNTFKWYDEKGVLQATITGDSSFTPGPTTTRYYVVATNAIAKELILYSDTIPPRGIPATVKTFTAHICGGTYYTLPSGASAGATGIYHDTLRNALGCDSVVSTLNLTVTNVITAQKSAIICDGAFYTLPSGQRVRTTGTHYDTVFTVAGCDSIVTILNLQVDTIVQQKRLLAALCNGYAASLVAPGPAINTYVWNTGATTSNITVTTPGQYTVYVSGANGCSAIDTFDVDIKDTPVVKLRSNIAICYGQVTTVDAGTGYTSYVWSNGGTTQALHTDKPGYYTITVTDAYGCRGSRGVDISAVQIPPAGFLPHDTTICSFTNLRLTVPAIYATYLWSDSSISNSFAVHGKGTYWLTVTDKYTCTGTDSIVITEKLCKTEILVPTAFTPNGDGHNDILKPIINGSANFTGYRFAVYNRYGQQIFASENAGDGWNGTTKGAMAMPGVYVWMFKYQLANAEPVVSKGTVVLLR